MYKRYGYSFKHDKKGADSSTDVRFVIGFGGFFIVLPLLLAGLIFSDPETSGNGGLVEAMSFVVFVLTLIVGSALAYIAVEFPEFGYTGIGFLSLTGAGAAIVCGLIYVIGSGSYLYLYYALVVSIYEIVIAISAFRSLESMEPANKTRNDDA